MANEKTVRLILTIISSSTNDGGAELLLAMFSASSSIGSSRPMKKVIATFGLRILGSDLFLALITKSSLATL
ncbi:hypothetical protein CFP56_019168 [Quercus suber]|uniref:Uncharacterized protein n=1 Tax=Quercus suber TaxID=58331 RepID=A0AAW0LZJ5_QUESU